MGSHIEPPEELISLINELNDGIAVSPRHVPIQPLYTTNVETDFSGCGSHEGFYRECVERAKPAITYSWEKISRENEGKWPRRLKMNYSVGKLPSEEEKYWPAFIEVDSNPYEANLDITFNENNERVYGQYAMQIMTAVVNHETGVHGAAYVLDKKLSENETEERNFEYLHDSGLHEEANHLEKIAKYIV